MGYGVMNGVGAGSYNTRPGYSGTQWRVRATQPEINSWCVLELEFYEDASCTAKVDLDMFNFHPIASGSLDAEQGRYIEIER